MTELVSPGVALAYVNWGRWVADCVRCPDAAELPKPYTPGFICGTCGCAVDVSWPEPKMVEGISRLLMLRLNPKNRNWVPGETLVDLQIENGRNGVFDYLKQVELPVGISLMSVSDDVVVRDALPTVSPVQVRQAVSQ